jgi:hypothetical protein
MNDWFIVYCLISRSQIFPLYGDVTITEEKLQNLGLCSTLRALEQEGIFIVPHLLWHRASVFPILFEVASYRSSLVNILAEVEYRINQY